MANTYYLFGAFLVYFITLLSLIFIGQNRFLGNTRQFFQIFFQKTHSNIQVYKILGAMEYRSYLSNRFMYGHYGVGIAMSVPTDRIILCVTDIRYPTARAEDVLLLALLTGAFTPVAIWYSVQINTVAWLHLFYFPQWTQ